MILTLILVSMIWGCLTWVIHRHSSRKGLMRRLHLGPVLLLLILILAACSGESAQSDSQTDSDKSSSPKTELITKKQYQAAKKEHTDLVAKDQELSKSLSAAEDKKQQVKDQLSQSQTEQNNQAEATTRQPSSSDNATSSSKPSNDGQSKGDMVTSDSNQIVGNVNLHIYHVPGQRGYSMSSKNAVFFHSEQEAIDNGYRKAKN